MNVTANLGYSEKQALLLDTYHSIKHNLEPWNTVQTYSLFRYASVGLLFPMVALILLLATTGSCKPTIFEHFISWNIPLLEYQQCV